jgi:hypothetical protein
MALTTLPHTQQTRSGQSGNVACRISEFGTGAKVPVPLPPQCTIFDRGYFRNFLTRRSEAVRSDGIVSVSAISARLIKFGRCGLDESAIAGHLLRLCASKLSRRMNKEAGRERFRVAERGRYFIKYRSSEAHPACVPPSPGSCQQHWSCRKGSPSRTVPPRL